MNSTNKEDNYIRTHYFEMISGLIIIGAITVVCMIAFLSEFGVHPDEFDVRACLDWCESRFIWPDMRLNGEGLGDTYSGYGYTKVCNYTPYFLIFSKISFIFRQFMSDLPYYRMPNLLLMVFMTTCMVKNVRKHEYLMLGFGMCVQAWYIFSYVTADALDFVLAFIAVALLADRESFLWRTIGECSGQGVRKPQVIIRCVVLGILYGTMMLGKPYYYAELLLTFVVLVWHLIKTEFNIRKQLLTGCLLIATVTFAIFGARAALDLHYYGLNKSEVKHEMETIYADYDKNPDTPPEEQAQSFRMYQKGYKVSDVFVLEPDWGKEIFRSMVSARVSSSGDEPYYVLMGVLYLTIYVMIGVCLVKQHDHLVFIAGTLINVIGVVAAVFSSYLSDIQPQGRYLLPVILTTCYLGSRAEALWGKDYYKIIVLVAGCLSVIYFGLYDMRALVDLGYVRTLLGM